MIINQSESLVLSLPGSQWAWTCDTRTNVVKHVRVSEASRTSLYLGFNDFFAIVHEIQDRDRILLTAHLMDDPGRPLASIIIEEGGCAFTGDRRLWEHLPRAYKIWYKDKTGKEANLLLIDYLDANVELRALNKGHLPQSDGIAHVLEIPNSSLFVFSFYKESSLLLYDIDAPERTRLVPLAQRGGNPHPLLRNAKELWADDYDTLVRVNVENWSVTDLLPLQVGLRGTAQFIGRFVFNPQKTLCAVARPFSGDVIALDTDTFKLKYSAYLCRKPLRVALLSDGRVYARDWKTGDLLKGDLRPI